MEKFKYAYMTLLALAILIVVNLLNYKSYQSYIESKNLDITAQTGSLTTQTAIPQTWRTLERDILTILGDEKNNYGIVVRELKTDKTLSINGDKIFPPASIYKVPLSIAVLREVDRGKTSLNNTYLVTDKQKVYDFDALSKREGDYEISLRELIRYTISHSDNTAMTTLEHRFGGVHSIQDTLKNELGINITRLPLQGTPLEVVETFEGIYSQKYLKKETNDFLLDQMKNTQPHFHDRILSGLPEGTVYAHKIGSLNNVHADAAIVYAENPYILVILNEGVNSQSASQKSQQITRTVHTFLNPEQ